MRRIVSDVAAAIIVCSGTYYFKNLDIPKMGEFILGMYVTELADDTVVSPIKRMVMRQLSNFKNMMSERVFGNA